jgi:hypothetical protein
MRGIQDAETDAEEEVQLLRHFIGPNTLLRELGHYLGQVDAADDRGGQGCGDQLMPVFAVEVCEQRGRVEKESPH